MTENFYKIFVFSLKKPRIMWKIDPHTHLQPIYISNSNDRQYYITLYPALNISLFCIINALPNFPRAPKQIPTIKTVVFLPLNR